MPDRDRVAQPGEPLCCRDAHALFALPPVELSALGRGVAQGVQDASGGGQQTVLSGGGCELAESRTEDEAALQVTPDEAMMLEGHGQAVGGRAAPSRWP